MDPHQYVQSDALELPEQAKVGPGEFSPASVHVMSCLYVFYTEYILAGYCTDALIQTQSNIDTALMYS